MITVMRRYEKTLVNKRQDQRKRQRPLREHHQQVILETFKAFEKLNQNNPTINWTIKNTNALDEQMLSRVTCVIWVECVIWYGRRLFFNPDVQGRQFSGYCYCLAATIFSPLCHNSWLLENTNELLFSLIPLSSSACVKDSARSILFQIISIS